MPSNNYKKDKQVISDLDLLLIEMWFLSNLRNKKIKFNPKPILDFFHIETKQPTKVNEKFVDLHFEIAKKVDALIAQYDSELQNNEPQMITTTQRKLPFIDTIEIRQPNIRQPEMSVFKPITPPNLNFGEVTPEEDFFEIIEPPEFIEVNEDIQEEDEETQSFMLGEKEKSTFRSFIGLGKIKVNNKKTTKTKSVTTKKPKEEKNGFTVKKEELEKTRQEIEERKKQLQKAKEKEKAKKLELKKQKKEKLKQEKIKKLEQKRIEKQKRLEKIKKLREEKQKQKEQERKEKLKAKELEKEVNEKIEKLKKEKNKILDKKEKQVEPAGMEEFIKSKKGDKTIFDKDVEKLIPIIDGLLEKLPDNEIEKFAKSKDFALYEKVVNKYKNT